MPCAINVVSSRKMADEASIDSVTSCIQVSTWTINDGLIQPKHGEPAWKKPCHELVVLFLDAPPGMITLMHSIKNLAGFHRITNSKHFNG